jgi:hypothetical protein
MIRAAPSNRAFLRAPEVLVRPNYPTPIAAQESGQSCRTAPTVRVSELSPAELDAHIMSLGQPIERAMRLGDRANAVQLRQCMYDAIASRSPAHKAAMEAEVQRRIDERRSEPPGARWEHRLMRDYAKVSPKFWTGETGQALTRRGSEALVVALYLMTSPHSNMLGLYYQPILYLAEETGLSPEGASKGLDACVEEGFCLYDRATKMVWVIEMASYQIGSELAATDKR